MGRYYIDVLYNPELRGNLFSEGVVTGRWRYIIKKGEQVIITKQRRTIAVGDKHKNNFYTKLFRTNENVSKLCNTKVKTSLQVLHDHIKLWIFEANDPRAENIQVDDEERFFCEKCFMAKQPFKASERVKSPQQITYSDICDPMSMNSVGGSRFITSIKNGAGSYKTVFFVKHKS